MGSSNIQKITKYKPKGKIKQWRRDYNEFRPHSSLNDLTPNEVHSEHNKSPISLIQTGT